jgi:hypothetical protein
MGAFHAYDIRGIYIILHVHVWKELHNKIITDRYMLFHPN